MIESQMGAKPQEFPKLVDKQPTLRNKVTEEVVPVPDRHVTEITGRDIQEKMFLRGMLRQETRGNDIIATQPLSFAVPRATADGTQPVLSIPDSEVPSSSRHLAPISASPNSIPKLTSPRSKLSQKQALTFPKKLDKLSKAPNIDTPRCQRSRKKNAGNQDAPAVLEKPLSQAANAIESVDRNMAKLKLSRAKTTELEKKGKHTRKRAPGEIINKSIGDTKKDHINCECGDEKFEEDTICCDNCDEWQHTDCYGFASAKDTRIPDHHVCYSCLLGKSEGKLLEEMRNMALFRRALRTIWRQGSFPSSNKAFANRLGVFPSATMNSFPRSNSRVIGCDLPTALQITRRLENEGFIANDPVKAKIHKKKVYKIVKTEDIVQLMESEYFDPLKKISHHVSTYG